MIEISINEQVILKYDDGSVCERQITTVENVFSESKPLWPLDYFNIKFCRTKPVRNTFNHITCTALKRDKEFYNRGVFCLPYSFQQPFKGLLSVIRRDNNYWLY